MGQTPDRRPGKLREDDSIVLADAGFDPTEAGELSYNGGAFRLRDASGVYDPRLGGSGFDVDSIVTSGSGDVYSYRSTGNVIVFNG